MWFATFEGDLLSHDARCRIDVPKLIALVAVALNRSDVQKHPWIKTVQPSSDCKGRFSAHSPREVGDHSRSQSSDQQHFMIKPSGASTNIIDLPQGIKQDISFIC
jgi:hypothetical protein